ncbi:MAG: chemotaxis protein CheA [Bacteroidales bacterium]|nr:chemotaxis protein CheA [Bacteroidales bacterium]MCF8457886.1 chemotaxis protein CheA [Bacteroidales bacterium]
MEDYQAAFIEEANDFVQILEESLLQLEGDRQNPEIINEIFRIMHSLKGSGAMFGFDDLSSYTHHLESLYDQVRRGEILINRAIIDFTFESVDHIKHLISFQPDEKYIKNSQSLIKRIPGLLMATEGDDKDIQRPIKSINTEKEAQQKKDQKKSYFIRFRPDTDILKDGTNPLYLIDELVAMGTCIVKARAVNIPDFNRLDPLDCFISWDFVLATKEDPSNIEDVFIFVSGTSEIEIKEIADFDIFEKDENKAKLMALLACPDVSSSDLNEFSDQQPILTRTPDLIAEEEPTEEAEEVTPEIQEKSNLSSTKKMRVSTVRVKAENLDNMINLVSELVTMQARLQNIAQENGDLELISFAENFQKLSRQFRDLSFGMRLVPIQNLYIKFQRLVHDVSKELDKDVDFVTEGLETELDKNVIEHISEPILHILRNSLDHGIESKETRQELNKPERATIQLKAHYSGADVIIQVTDDGAGIDLEGVRHSAIEKGLIKATTKLSSKEILDLLFEPGFSTKQDVSNLSGRGVGMDVVKRKIEELRGSVELHSEKEKGTVIKIRLPLTLSMIDGFLVKIRENSFIIPLLAIDKIHELKTGQLDKAFNHIIKIEDEQVPFINLMNGSFDGFQDKPAKYLVLINFENKKVGLAVNEVLGEYQVVLKPLGHLLKTKDYFSGATIMGDGKVALVIDTNKLIQQFAK